MDHKTGKANHIQDYLVRLHTGQWFTWTDSKNKIYANLRLTDKVGIKGEIVDNLVTQLPTEQECTDGLATLQTTFDNAVTKKATDKTNANNKLKALGLTDDEIKAIKGIA